MTCVYLQSLKYDIILGVFGGTLDTCPVLLDEQRPCLVPLLK